MNTIIRFINQNRRNIIIIIAIMVFIFIIIPSVNKIEGERQNKQYEQEQASKVVLTEEEEKLPTKSLIGAGTVSLQKTKQNVNIIEQFVEKCNNNDVTGAYNMLTDECKQTLFTTEENFRIGYHKLIFSKKRLVDMEQFVSANKRYTYEVKFYEDMLSTGSVDSAGFYQDYITIDDNSTSRKNKFK